MANLVFDDEVVVGVGVVVHDAKAKVPQSRVRRNG
jgi:hypothetical protein